MISVVLALLVVGVTAQLQCSEPAVDIRLQPKAQRPPSFLFSNPSNDEPIAVTRSQPLPRVVVQILDGGGSVDVGVSEYMKVRATGSDVSVSLSGTEAIVYNGEAHFTDLRVNDVSISIFHLVFTAIVESTVFKRAVNGKNVTTGPLSFLTRTVPVYQLSFQPIKSYITSSAHEVDVVPGEVLPEIRVAVLDSAYNLYVRQLSQGTGSNQTVSVSFAGTVSDGTYIVGGSAPVLQGVATFRELQIIIESNAASLPRLVFSLEGSGVSVQSGAVRSTRITENARIAFEDESASFIYSQEQNFTAMGGVALPPILISLRNTLLRASPPSTGLVITAHIPAGGRARLSGNVVGVVNGVARFDSLTFEQIEHSEQLPYVIRFVAGAQGALPLAGQELVTGIVLVSSQRIPAYSMRFRQSALESFFTAQGQEAQVVQGQLRLPVQLELFDSANDIDLNTTVQVEAIQYHSSGDQKSLTDQPETFTGGRVTFAGLRLASSLDPEDIVLLLFRAKVTAKHLAVEGQVLLSGALNVTSEVPNFDIQFQAFGASLFSQPTQASFATVGVPLPPIVVQIVTSAQIVDSQSNELGITATADGGAIVSGNFMRVSGGVAVFSDLTFVSETPGSYRITFTAGGEGDTPVAGKSIETGLVTVVGSLTPDFRPRFQNTSFIAYPGHIMPMTLGFAMPNVSIELVNSAHEFETTNVSGLVHSRLRAVATLSGGFTFSQQSGPLFVPLVDGVAVFQGLRIDSGFNPIVTICIESSREGDPDPANGQCVSSGPLVTYSSDTNGALQLLEDSQTEGRPVDLYRQYSSTFVQRGATLRTAVVVLNSSGWFPQGERSLAPLSVTATSTIPLSGDTRVDINRSTGVAYFDNLRFSRDFPLGITPVITFSVVLDITTIRPISTGLLSVARTGQSEGVVVVAELLTEFSTFSFEQWRAAVARRLNIEPARITQLYSFSGTSAEPQLEVTEDTTYRLPDWRGTRVEMRFLPPLPTSRDTKSASDIAAFFVSFVPSCRIGELQLRHAYLKANDLSCDWYIFDSQMNGVRSCLQARDKPGFCACHVPLFATMGKRCLGLPRMTTLCLDVLINSRKADCQEPAITTTCQLLEFPDVPRTWLAGTGVFLFLFFPPLVYLHYRGFFHKVGRGEDAKVLPLEATGDGADFL